MFQDGFNIEKLGLVSGVGWQSDSPLHITIDDDVFTIY